MAPKSYRFQTTLEALCDCKGALDEMESFPDELTGDELAAAKQLIETCKEIALSYGRED